MSETLFGKYRLLAELGRGGMADVYLAAATGLGGFQKLVVLKVSRVSDDPAFAQMFLDEARLSARLSHVNVVQTYEVGEEAGRQYIVMEYLDGPSLHRLNRLTAAQGGVPLRMMVQILSNVLAGLQYAHTLKDFDGSLLNVVHRDLSPQNLMVTAQGACKLLDFGIAKTTDSRTQTHAGFYRGKINYMAPEQALGNAVDARADVFSVGVLLAEAITRKPFWGDATTAIISSKLVTGDLPDIEQARIEPILEEICKAALAHDREQRTPTAQDFKNALDWYLGTRGGPVSPEELAEYLAPLIAEDRRRVNALIDQQLKQGAAPVPFNLPLPQANSAQASSYASVTGPSSTPYSTRGSGYTPAPATPAAIAAARGTGAQPLVAAELIAPPRPVTSARPLIVVEPTPPPVASPAMSAELVPVGALSPAGQGVRPPLPAAVGVDRSVRSATRKPTPGELNTRLVIGLVASGFAVLVGLVVWLVSRTPAVSAAPVAPVAAVTEPTPPAAVTPPRPHLVELSVKPASATLELDGVVISNPWATATLDARAHQLTARAEGYVTQTREVTFDRDLSVSLVLEAQAAPVMAVTPPAEPKRVAVVAPAHRAPPPKPAAAKERAAAARPEPAEAAPIQELTPRTKPAGARRNLDTEVFDETRKEIDRSNPWDN